MSIKQHLLWYIIIRLCPPLITFVIFSQTRLHDGPLCGKRTVATIATHDLKAIKSPLLYDARLPATIQVILGAKSRGVGG